MRVNHVFFVQYEERYASLWSNSEQYLPFQNDKNTGYLPSQIANIKIKSSYISLMLCKTDVQNFYSKISRQAHHTFVHQSLKP